MTPASIDDAAHILREFATSLLRNAPRSHLSRTAAGTLSVLDRRGPQRITSLAESEVISQPAMTGLVQRLEAAGLVARKSDPADGRAILIAITAAGHTAMHERRREHDQMLAERIVALTPEHRVLLMAALPAIAALAGPDFSIPNITENS